MTVNIVLDFLVIKIKKFLKNSMISSRFRHLKANNTKRNILKLLKNVHSCSFPYNTHSRIAKSHS